MNEEDRYAQDEDRATHEDVFPSDEDFLTEFDEDSAEAHSVHLPDEWEENDRLYRGDDFENLCDMAGG